MLRGKIGHQNDERRCRHQAKCMLRRGKKTRSEANIQHQEFAGRHLLVWRLVAYLWESGRDPEFSTMAVCKSPYLCRRLCTLQPWVCLLARDMGDTSQGHLTVDGGLEIGTGGPEIGTGGP
jgi:hypothetical protein